MATILLHEFKEGNFFMIQFQNNNEKHQWKLFQTLKISF